MGTGTPFSRSNEPPTLSAITMGVGTFLVALVCVALAVGYVGEERVILQGVIGSFGGGVAGLAGFTAVYLVSGRSLEALGIRSAGSQWLNFGMGLGLVSFGLSLVIQDAYAGVAGHVGQDSQAVLHRAVQGGMLSFVLAFLGGAILTPIGEEFLFRGVVANALNKYGAWAGVGLSALIFGIVHGLGMIMLLAIMIGLISGILFRTTGSVWPCVISHAVYNGLYSIASALA